MTDNKIQMIGYLQRKTFVALSTHDIYNPKIKDLIVCQFSQLFQFKKSSVIIVITVKVNNLRHI